MIRILIVDDHKIFREGIARLLRDHEDFNVVAESSSMDEAIATLRNQPVDVAIVDRWSSGREEGDLIVRIKSAQPGTRVLFITLKCGEFSAVRALRAGADGYMTMENASAEMVAAIRQIALGTRYVCPTVAGRLAMAMANNGGAGEAHECLSDREFKVFEMLVAGKRGAQIASELALSEKTVSTHKTHVLRKLSANSSSDLVRYAIRHQLVPE